ncbi:MAG: transglutaminase-like domain-containing protein [bacterium]
MKLLKVLIVFAWIITMALLLKKEGFLSRSYNITYYDILGKKDPYREEYLGIYLDNEKIGFSKSYIDAYSFPGNRVGFSISNETRVFVKAFGEPSSINITTEVLIDDNYRLSSFSSILSSKQYKIEAKGERVANKIIASIYSGERLIVKREFKEKDFAFLGEILPLSSLPSLSEGRVYCLKSFDPFGIMGDERISLKVLKRTTIMYDDELFETYPIIISYQNIRAKLYTTRDGKILKAYLPYGFLAKKEDEKKAKKIKFSYPDISSLSSIPSNRIIEEPRKVSYFKIKMDKKIVVIKKDTFPETAFTLPIKEYLEFTKETAFVQSNDKGIIEQARKIIGKEKDSQKASILLMEWVCTNLSQKPAFSLPSAIEVLKNKTGDCNEHTILFTALARSIGIPTKMTVGLCYLDKRFYYHAWAKVFCGKWVSIDPTFNQAPADATHIPLIEGDIGEQIGLLGYIGNIKVEVLDYD